MKNPQGVRKLRSKLLTGIFLTSLPGLVITGCGIMYIRARYGFDERTWSFLLIALVACALALAGAILSSAWLQKNFTRPILGIRGVARQVIDSRDFTLRATKTADDEIGSLVDAFNDMLAEINCMTQALESSNTESRRLNANLEQRIYRCTLELESTNRELESFSYSVSHDLRAPLRAIDGYARMVEEDYGDRLDDDGKRMLAVVRDEAVRMGRLIDDLLSFSKLSRQAMDPVRNVNMTRLAQEVAQLLVREQDAERVRFDIRPLPSVEGDVLLLREVWTNLLGNALKYSGGKPQAEILVRGELQNGNALFRVQDNGVGFDMKYAANLFGIFQRLHKAEEFEGTGMGLAIVHRVVTRHGGSVHADARPGEGATFHFTLPAGSTHA